MGFESFLKTVGKDFKKGLDAVLPFLSAGAGALSVVNPAYGALAQTTLATIISVEQKFAASGAGSGSGAQKLADAVTILEPAVKNLFAQYGYTIDTTHVQNYVNAAVSLLNALPALPPAPAQAPASK